MLEMFQQETVLEPTSGKSKITKLPSQPLYQLSTFVEDSDSTSHFQVLKEISRGTMSTVYYCDGKIALKTMGEEECFSEPSDAVIIYRNDLQVLQSIGQHPNIVRLHETTDEAWITHTTTGAVEKVHNCQVLEALHGGELFYHIVRHGPFSSETARGFLG